MRDFKGGQTSHSLIRIYFAKFLHSPGVTLFFYMRICVDKDVNKVNIYVLELLSVYEFICVITICSYTHYINKIHCILY